MDLLAVVGPTGTGKSALAMDIAQALGGEIVCVDSAQVFRGLDIGTAKPSTSDRSRVRHHMLDLIGPEQRFSAAHYVEQADQAIREVRGRGHVPILCGGTGLWLRALLHGLFEVPTIDPSIRTAIARELATGGPERLHQALAQVDPLAAGRIQSRDPQRISRALEVFRQTGVPISELQARHGFREHRYHVQAIGIHWPKDQLERRLAERTFAMYRSGLVEETRAILATGLPPDAPGLRIIGYRDATLCALGQISLQDAIERTLIATRQYAKRQRNWFRSETVDWIASVATASDALARLHTGFVPV